MKKFLLCIIIALAAVSCGIYSFTGTNIQPDVKTITIPLVEYKALRVNPSLANDLTEALHATFESQTSSLRPGRTETPFQDAGEISMS